ncbi:hypothetical protein AB0F09_19160 [Streptomyces olivaceus]|uniref:hypothetical protein n=1 Tax=Streptomyces olivaceus TaxID=47716 RepID=UPI00340D417A
MTGPLCGAPHHDHPETLCTQPARHYRRDRDPHGGPLIIDGRERGSAAWDEPQEQQMTDRIPLDDLTSDQLDALYEQLATAQQEADASVAAAAQLTTLVGKRSEKAEKAAKAQQQRARIAETELHVLRSGLRANGADPTQIQNLWAQIRMRNRQWREEKQRAEAAEHQIRILTAFDEGRAHGAQRVMDERDQAQQRAAQAEAALVRVHHLAALIHAGAPWTANHTELAARIRAAITGPTTTEK